MQKKGLIPELLAPAGNAERLRVALHFGADAVYLSGKNFGLRAFADNFTAEELIKAAELCRGQGRKIYVTVNIFARNADFGELKDYLSVLEAAGVDALIVSDPGVIDFIRTNSTLPLHLSTQANTLNKYAVKFWAGQGIKRIVLARELSLGEIREIRDFVDCDTELETFVHGAMCISYSGRCLLSNYLSGRDSNRGECVQACRWEYSLTEANREGEPLTVAEDGRGTYILNSRDLNMIRHISALTDAGVSSFKIEGRIKTAYYVATVVNAYRRALDAVRAGNYTDELADALFAETEKTSHRLFTTGFYLGEGETECRETSKPRQSYDFAAVVKGRDKERSMYVIEQRNRFKSGDTLEVLSPSPSFNRTVEIGGNLFDLELNAVDDAMLVQQELLLKTDIELNANDILRKRF